jgi:uncharacterized protein YlaI
MSLKKAAFRPVELNYGRTALVRRLLNKNIYQSSCKKCDGMMEKETKTRLAQRLERRR